jgi:hypothetical protein
MPLAPLTQLPPLSIPLAAPRGACDTRAMAKGQENKGKKNKPKLSTEEKQKKKKEKKNKK